MKYHKPRKKTAALSSYKTKAKGRPTLRRKSKKSVPAATGLEFSIFDHIQDSILITDAQGIITFANQTFLESLGRMPEQVIGQPVTMLDTIYAINVPVRDILEKTISDKSWSGVIEITDQNREKRLHEIRTWSMTGSGSQTAGMVAVWRDITGRVRSENQLRYSEERYRTLVENAFDGIYLIRGRHYEYVNPKFCEITGYTAEELTAPDFNYDILLTDASKTIIRQRHESRQLRKSVPSQYEIQIIKKGGREIVDVEISTVGLESAGEYRVLGIMRDVSDRKKIQSALEESELKFQAMFETASIGLTVTDPKGRFLQVNSAFAAMTGYTPEELFRMRASDISHPDDFEREADDFRTLMSHQERTNYRSEKRYIRKDGRIIWARLNGTIIRDSDGRPQYVFGVVEDITDARRIAQLAKVQRDVAVALGSSDRMASVLNQVLEIACTIEGIDCGGIYLYDERNILRLYAHRGLSPEFVRKVSYYPAEQPQSRIVLEGKPQYFVYESFLQDKNIELDHEREQEGLKAIAILPIPSEGRVAGVINLSSHTMTEIVPEVRALLEMIAAEIGGACARIRATEALRKSEERIKQLLDSATDYVYSVDIHDGVVQRTRHGARCVSVTGYTSADYESSPFLWYDMIYADDKSFVTEQLARVLAGEQVPPFEHRIIHKDGSIRWIRNTPVLKISGGKVIGYDGMISDVTERKRAETELRESEASYRGLFNSVTDAIYIQDTDGRFLDVNDGAVKMYGYSRNQLIGQTPEFVAAPGRNDMSYIQNCLRAAFGGTPQRFEFWGRRLDGSVFPKDVRLFRGMYFGKEVVIAMAQDITEQKAAEEALRKNEEDLQRILDSIPAMVWYKDLDNRILAANRGVADMEGIPIQELQGRSCWELYPEDQARRFYEEDLEVIRSGQPRLGIQEIHTAKRTGRMYWLEVSKVPVFNRNREMIGIIAFAIDITERKKAEEALLIQTARFRQLFENSPLGIVLLDNQDRIIEVNAGFQDIFQYAPDEVLGKKINDIIVPETLKDEGADLSEQTQRGIIVYKETVRKRKDGSLADVYIYGVPVFIGGQQEGIYGIYADQSERKRLERQLIQVQKMESIGTLSGGIAHDFNNVLAVVLSTAELIRKRVRDNPDLVELAEMIISSAFRGKSITQQLLLFARAEDSVFRPVELTQIVREAVQLLEHSLPKTIHIETVIGAEHDMILADPSHIHQIILNLAINARDAMPSGGTLTLGLRTALPGELEKHFSEIPKDDFVVLYVSDTGTGIDKSILNRIFDPFFTTKEQGKGTGLGLSIVHGIVKNHKGYISVESEPGKGSVFYMYFPAHKAASVSVPKPENGACIPEGKETILIVDDEPALRESLAEILQWSGYEVIKAESGLSALNIFKIQKEKINLVITDIGMPVMDGIRLFEQMKAVDPDVKVLVATGYQGETSTDNLLRKGVVDILTKPYAAMEILQRVRRALDKKR